MSPNEIIANGTAKEQHTVHKYNSNNSNSVNHNFKNHCECNNSNSSNKKRIYQKIKDNDNDEMDDDNIKMLPSQGTCDSLNSIVLEEYERNRRLRGEGGNTSVSPSVSPSVSSSTINSCSGCGRLPTTTSPSPSDQEFDLDATIKRSLYRTRNSYSSTNSSSNPNLHSTNSSPSVAVNNLDDSLTIISNNRDASIKLDGISQRSYSISTSDNAILDDDLDVANVSIPTVAHLVEHEVCDERKSKSSLVKKRHRASNHNDRSDSRRFARSSSSSSSCCSTIHSNNSFKRDTHRDARANPGVHSHVSGNQTPLASSTQCSKCSCSNYHSNYPLNYSDTPESALIPQPNANFCHCSHPSATCSKSPSKKRCSSTNDPASCKCSNNCCCGCDKSIQHNASSTTDLADDEDVDDDGPKQSSHPSFSSSTSLASSSPVSIASKSSSISSIYALRVPQSEIQNNSNTSRQKHKDHKNHIKTIL